MSACVTLEGRINVFFPFHFTPVYDVMLSDIMTVTSSPLYDVSSITVRPSLARRQTSYLPTQTVPAPMFYYFFLAPRLSFYYLPV